MKKIIVVNASPRKGWNTDMMVSEAAKGAESAGVGTEIVQLYQLSNYSGCRSCFGCKTGKNLGKCVYPDDFKTLLDKIREADGLIIGAPIYIGDLAAGFRRLYERLIFQYVAYQKDRHINLNGRKIPVLLVVTGNAPLATFEEEGYAQMIEKYRDELSHVIGPTEVVIADETMQVNDYEKYNWTLFDYEDRRRRRREVFSGQLQEAYRKGAEMAVQN